MVGASTEIRGRVPLVGQFGARRALSAAMRLLSDDLTGETTDALTAAGMIVTVMSDSAYAHPSMADADCLAFQQPVTVLRSAQRATR